MIGEIFIAAFIIVLSAFAGKVVMWGTLGKWIGKNMRFLTTFALGVFSIMLVFMYKGISSFSLPLWKIILFIVMGILFLEIVQKLIPDGHHHHGEVKDECCKLEKINPRRIVIGDFFHNMADGIALSATFLISSSLGWSIALGIFIHEFVQETSEFFLLREGGYSVKKALWSNFFVQLSIFIGVVLTLFFKGKVYVPILISLSFGMLAFIVFRDLLPHSLHLAKKKKEYGKHFFVWVLGVITMLVVKLIFH